MNGLVTTKIPDITWGEPKVCRAVGNDRDPWGVLAVLRETPWEALIPLIPSRVFDQALRGHATPMMRLIGPPTSALAKRLPVLYAQCRERDQCVNSSPTCVPGGKMPDCWEGDGIDREAVGVASQVARMWRDGTLVIVVVPEE